MVKYTNKYKFPKTIYNLLALETYEKSGDISVTTLIGPPQINVLRVKHEDEMVIDVKDRMFSVFGTAVHSMLEQVFEEGDLVEKRLITPITTPLGTLELSGKPDLLDKEGNLRDYKVTSGWSVLHGEAKPEWEAQLNIYKWMLEQEGYEVRRLVIDAIIRDWGESLARRTDGFPKTMYKRVPINIWSKERVENYIQDRTILHQQAIGGEVVECTEEERWARPSQYAVMKRGRKKALKLFQACDIEQAYLMADRLKAGHYVEYRSGQNIRCEKYCDVAKYCKQYATIKEINEKEMLS